MAFFTTSFSTSTQIVANSAGDIWIVRAGVYVTVLGDAIEGSGSFGNKTFHIDGHLFSDSNNGIDLGNFGDVSSGFNEVYVSQTGSITAQSDGVESDSGGLTFINDGMVHALGGRGVFAKGGSNNLTNNGTISANSDGLYAQNGNNSLINNGSISSNDEGLEASGGDNILINTGTILTQTAFANGMTEFSGDNSKFVNSGEITTQGANSNGIRTVLGTGHRLVNSGEINVLDNTSNAVRMESGAGEETRLVNTGLLSAPDVAVFGGTGDETVFNRGTIDGHVDLGDGDDVFKGRDGVVNGEVRGGGGADALIGSKADDDVLKGGSGADILKGKDGDDDLFGGGGADILTGGRGDDKLTGNGGPDIFVFGKNQGNDVITDFTNGSDKIDLSAFGFKNKAQALAAFSELGSGSNDKLAFDFGNTTIIVKGIDMGDLNGADINI